MTAFFTAIRTFFSNVVAVFKTDVAKLEAGLAALRADFEDHKAKTATAAVVPAAKA